MPKYGRRSPKNAPALLFAKYAVSGAQPTFPPDDYLSRVNWAGTMNGNDKYGDCVACATANTIELITTVLAGAPVKASEAEVLAFYKTQNPNFPSQDDGMDMQTACETLVKTGIQIGGVVYKALGFAKVDVSNLAELKAAVSVFGSVFTGVNVADVQQQQFPNVWSYVASSPIEGGHAIITGGHADVASNDLKAACWAAEFGVADSFVQHQYEEAWVIIWPWHLGSKEFIAGMDLGTFASDYKTITGQDFPVQPTPSPSPAPQPTPTPAPTPSPTVPAMDVALWNELKSWSQLRHTGSNHDAAVAVHEWALNWGLNIGPHTPEHSA